MLYHYEIGWNTTLSQIWIEKMRNRSQLTSSEGISANWPNNPVNWLLFQTKSKEISFLVVLTSLRFLLRAPPRNWFEFVQRHSKVCQRPVKKVNYLLCQIEVMEYKKLIPFARQGKIHACIRLGIGQMPHYREAVDQRVKSVAAK